MLLLDTCCLLWLAGDAEQFSSRARSLIEAAAGGLFISAISAFEIALKDNKGRLILPLLPEEWMRRTLSFHGIRELPVTWQIAARSALLPPLHADPCDRIILATGELHGVVIVTPDPLLHSYPGAAVEW